jgi:hypothetical protein
MDYILVLVFFVVVPIVVFFLLKERPHRVGGPGAYDRGITVSEPAADQPTPQANAVNQVTPGREKRIPPG